MSSEVLPVARESAATELQILATEHWSLLATRSLTYTESLGRVNGRSKSGLELHFVLSS
jgi:hypothetical protein